MTQIESIINVFTDNSNPWLDYNEIYEKMDQSLFGINKNGEQGKKNIVYRLILGKIDLFDVDENFRPKKFRLKSSSGKIDEAFIQNQVKYSFGDSKLFINNEEYKIVEYAKEEQIEKEVIDNYKLIFGEKSVYFDIKKKLGPRICDGFVFDKELNRFIVVENELCIHDLWGHIIPQIIDFFNALKDETVKTKLKYEIDWNLSSSEQVNMIKAIDKMNFDIVVVIDKITFDIAEQRRAISQLCEHFNGNADINIYFKEFKIFQNEEGKKVYLVSYFNFKY